MEPPRLEKIVTKGAITWRVCYVGMERNFARDHEAIRFYEHLCQCYASDLAKGLNNPNGL